MCVPNNAIKIFFVVLLAANLSVAQEADSIAAEYCLNLHHDSRMGWRILSHEWFVPLTITMQTEHSSSRNNDIIVSLDAGFTTFGFTSLELKGPGIGNPTREMLLITEKYDFYEIFGTMFIQKKGIDSVQISTLFGKAFPVEWSMNIGTKYQPLNISGSYYAEITGFFTEKQLKKIAEDKKKREGRNKTVKKSKGK
jgi:hypothetical protein